MENLLFQKRQNAENHFLSNTLQIPYSWLRERKWFLLVAFFLFFCVVIFINWRYQSLTFSSSFEYLDFILSGNKYWNEVFKLWILLKCFMWTQIILIASFAFYLIIEVAWDNCTLSLSNWCTIFFSIFIFLSVGTMYA